MSPPVSWCPRAEPWAHRAGFGPRRPRHHWGSAVCQQQAGQNGASSEAEVLLGLKEEQDLNVKLMVVPKEDAEKEGPRKNRSRMSCQSE